MTHAIVVDLQLGWSHGAVSHDTELISFLRRTLSSLKTPRQPPKPQRSVVFCPCGRREPRHAWHSEIPRTEHALARPVPSGRPSRAVGIWRRPGERPGSTGVPLPSAGEARPLHIPMVMPCCFLMVRGSVLPIDLRNPVPSTPYRFNHHLDLFALTCLRIGSACQPLRLLSGRDSAAPSASSALIG